jgi:hypothetical protein
MYNGVAERISALRWQRWFVIGISVLIVLLSIQYSIKAIGTRERSDRSAFLRWRDQVRHIGAENIYERYAFPNPPITALLLFPLAQLPALPGSIAWFYLKVGMAALAVIWIFRIIETPEAPFPTWAKVATILLGIRPVVGDLSHGNINLFILFLVAAALYAFHSKRDYAAGLLLALSIACKVTPALFIPYFLWKRAWKTLAGCTLGLFLFLVAIPGVFLGQGRNLELLKSWTHQMVTPYVVGGVVTSDHPNQSLPGLLYRLGTHSPSFLDATGAPARYDNLADLDPGTAGWLVKAGMALFVVLIVACCRTPITPRQGWRLAAEFSLIVLGMLLFSERTWKHHCVTVLLPFAVMIYNLAAVRPATGMRVYLVSTLVAAWVLMTVTSTTGLLAGLDNLARMAQVYGTYVWAYLMLVAALAIMLRQKSGLCGPGSGHGASIFGLGAPKIGHPVPDPRPLSAGFLRVTESMANAGQDTRPA